MMLLAMYNVWSTVQSGADAAGELLRPVLGGAIVNPTLAPYPTYPGPTPTPGGSPPTQVPVGTDISLIVLLISMVFAIFAFFAVWRGVRAEVITMVIVGTAFVLLTYAWSSIAKWINHFYKLFYFAIIERGIFTDDPTEAWKSVSGMDGLVPTSDEAIYWQIFLFLLGVAFAYLVTMPVWWPKKGAKIDVVTQSFAERLIASVVSGFTGFMISIFVLTRIIPDATMSIFTPGSISNEWLQYVVPIALAVLVIAIILYGWRSLGPRRYKKTYS